MHRTICPPEPQRMQLKNPIHRPIKTNHLPKLLQREISQLPIQVPSIVIRVHISWFKLQEDAQFLSEGRVAEGLVFPVALVNEAALGQFPQPLDHLSTDGEGEEAGAQAVGEPVVGSDEYVLVASPAGDVDFVGIGGPFYGAVCGGLFTADGERQGKRDGEDGLSPSLTSGCRPWILVVRSSETLESMGVDDWWA